MFKRCAFQIVVVAAMSAPGVGMTAAVSTSPVAIPVHDFLPSDITRAKLKLHDLRLMRFVFLSTYAGQSIAGPEFSHGGHLD